jgi:hypothetical protein
VKFLYFVDRDFDPPINNSLQEVYETKVYSVENFYTTEEAFIRILKIEFNYTEVDREYKLLLDLFRKRQQEFHQKTAYLNAWIACQRDESISKSTGRLNLSDFNLASIITKIDLDNVVSTYDKATLEHLLPMSLVLDEIVVQNKIAAFSKQNPQEIFRGKFEIDFLYAFIEAIKIEYNKSGARLKKKEGVQLNQSKKNLIAEFSQYATTPISLKEYLQKYVKAS